jgi:hypothetical protein
MKRAQSTQLSFLKRPAPRGADAKKQARGSSPAFDEAFEAAQRAQVIPLKPQLVDPPALQLPKAAGPKEPHLVATKAAPTDAAQPLPKKAERRPVEHEPFAPHEARAQRELTPFSREAAAPPLTTQVPAPPEVAPVVTARPVDPANALLQLALHDTSLTLDVQSRVVRVALETEAAGQLSLEVRVHENRADLRVDGPASPLVVQNEPALREVLSSQGLSLGDFSLGQRDDSPERAVPELPEGSPRPPAPTPSVTAPSRAHRHDGRIDVKA